MKKALLAIVLLLLSTFAFSQERIAVFPFEDLDNILTKSESVIFYRNFSNEFTNKNAGRFTIVPRQDVEKLFNAEEKFQLSDLSARAKTAETQRVLNGTQILSGIIGKAGNRITISVSLYTFPELSQLPGGFDLRVTNKDEIFDKIPELVKGMQSTITSGSNTTSPSNRTTTNQTAIPTNFVRVEGGTFQMGTPSGGVDDERPVHTVTVKSFNISKYEVTQKEWYEVMGTSIRQQRDIAGSSSLYGEGDDYPMYYVNWYEAVEYCNKRSLKEGLTLAYQGTGDNITCDWNANGYRLPTEAEWEFAAKGGTKDYLTNEYSGSNSVDGVAWYDKNSGNRTHSVGTKVANSLGIHDMSGNVWKWCWDWYDNYSSISQTAPRGPVSGTRRVVRGGSWFHPAMYTRSARRYRSTPSVRGDGLGFRLVRN